MNEPRDSHTLRSWSYQYQAQAQTLDLGGPSDWLIALTRACDEGQPLIPRGAGLSWTDIAMAEGGLVANTCTMNAVTAFDTGSGHITAQSGISLGDLLDRTLPHGWTLNCLPGNLDVTLGGAIGCNVHGKDAFHHGAFCEQVERLTLADGSGRIHDLHRDKDRNHFDAVTGGMGLTGLICDATLKLSPVPTSHIARQQHVVNGVDGMIDLIGSAGDQDFLWGWLDPRRAMFGEVQALATAGNWVACSDAEGPKRHVPLTRALPVLTPFVTADRAQRWMSRVHGWARRRCTHKPESITLPWREALFPHARLSGLDRLFASNGFLELQAILPPSRLEDFFAGLRALEPHERLTAFLVSFKVHRTSRGLLAFSGDGIGLSFVSTVFDQDAERLSAQLQTLRDLIARHGGRLNLHRDGDVTLPMAREMYPGFKAFLDVKENLDPNGCITSDYWSRLIATDCHDR